MDNHFHFRLTDDIEASEVVRRILKVTKEPVKGIPTVIAVITGKEIGTKSGEIHSHSAIYTNMSRHTLNKRLQKEFDAHGNVDFSLGKERNKVTHFSYVIKEGNIAYSENFETDIKPVAEIPPWVYPQEAQADFDDQVKELDQRYLDSTMSDDSYLNSLLAIYGNSQRKSLFLHHIKSHWLALLNRRNLQGTKKIYHDPEDHTTRWETTPLNPRQELVNSIKKFIIE